MAKRRLDPQVKEVIRTAARRQVKKPTVRQKEKQSLETCLRLRRVGEGLLRRVQAVVEGKATGEDFYWQEKEDVLSAYVKLSASLMKVLELEQKLREGQVFSATSTKEMDTERLNAEDLRIIDYFKQRHADTVLKQGEIQ